MKFRPGLPSPPQRREERGECSPAAFLHFLQFHPFGFVSDFGFRFSDFRLCSSCLLVPFCGHALTATELLPCRHLFREWDFAAEHFARLAGQRAQNRRQDILHRWRFIASGIGVLLLVCSATTFFALGPLNWAALLLGGGAGGLGLDLLIGGVRGKWPVSAEAWLHMR